MKRLFFIYLLVVFTSFANIVDNVDLFGKDDEILLAGRIAQLKEMYDLDFMIYTNSHKDYSLKNILKERKKTVVIAITQDEDNVVNVQLSVSEDIDMTSYGEEISKVLDNLDVLMKNEEYSDYTLELLANVGEVVNLVNMEKADNIKLEKESAKTIFSSMFKILLIFVCLSCIYYFYRFFLARKHLTTCSICGKNMVIDEEIEKGDKIMKIYKCSSCGKIKRINIKKN